MNPVLFIEFMHVILRGIHLPSKTGVGGEFFPRLNEIFRAGILQNTSIVVKISYYDIENSTFLMKTKLYTPKL